MDKKFWKFAGISSLLCLVPLVWGLLLWDQLPAHMVNHWNAAGEADGWAEKIWVVLSLPLLMFGCQWMMVGGLYLDRRNVAQNPKLLRVLLMIFPVLSNVLGGMLYGVALDYDLPMDNAPMVVMGLMFLAMGNYLPKCRRNATLGIKLPWTLYNEENWNRTHRFGGKVFVAGGAVILLLCFLPLEQSVFLLLPTILALAVLPTLYSWRLYRQQVAAGRWQGPAADHDPKTRKLRRATYLVLAATLAVVCFICFTGNIDFVLQEDSFIIHADFHEDLTVSYDRIESAELRTEPVPGFRVWGISSLRISCGTFENSELGRYTRYTHASCESAIVLKNGDHILVINAETEAETEQLYQALLQRLGR